MHNIKKTYDEFEQLVASRWFPYFFCDKSATLKNSKRIDSIVTGYETREKGYFESLIGAVKFLKNNINSKLSTDLIKQLHYHATKKCSISGYFDQSEFEKDDFYAKSMSVGMICTREGMEENYRLVEPLTKAFKLRPVFVCVINNHTEPKRWLELKPDYTTNDGITIGVESENIIRRKIEKAWRGRIREYVWYSKRDRVEIAENTANYIINGYNDKISTFTKKQKPRLIVETVKTLELLHPFSDGNCRTFFMVLLNHLLIVNGFQPFVLSFNPNLMHGCSVAEALWMILAGQQAYKNMQTKFRPCHFTPSFKDEPVSLGRIYACEKLRKLERDKASAARFLKFSLRH